MKKGCDSVHTYLERLPVSAVGLASKSARIGLPCKYLRKMHLVLLFQQTSSRLHYRNAPVMAMVGFQVLSTKRMRQLQSRPVSLLVWLTFPSLS